MRKSTIYIILFLLFFSSHEFMAQGTDSLEIQVVGQDGISLVGVHVESEDGLFLGITDENGDVLIAEQPAEYLISFSYIGFQTTEIKYGEIEARQGIITLAYSQTFLDEIVVIGRTDQKAEDIAQLIETISAEDIRFSQPQTSADALQQNSQVFVQKSQMGGGSPILRGFEANKILLAVDGIRMNNAIYRNGHLQNAITVGSSILDRIEILYGPGSLEYGSDAIGGVIHFRTIDPPLAPLGQKSFSYSGNAMARYSTANNEKTGMFNLAAGNDKFGWLASINYSDFGDLRMGNNRTEAYPDFGKRLNYVKPGIDGDQIIINPDPNVQVGTAYSQYDIMQKFRFRPSEFLQLSTNFQYSNSSDVPRYDNLTEINDGTLRYAEWYYGPQERLLAAATVQYFRKTSLFDSFKGILSYQKIAEDRVSRTLNTVNREHNLEGVTIYAFNGDFHKYLFKGQRNILQYGFELNRNDVTSDAFTEDIETGLKGNDILTRYPDGASSIDAFGLYAKYSWENQDGSQKLSGGLRFSSFKTKLRFDRTDIIMWPIEFTEGVISTNEALTWSIGYRGGKETGFRYRMLVSNSFRIPNIDDLGKLRVQGGNVVVPNLDVGPEKSTSAELSLEYKWGNLVPQAKSDLSVGITGYYTKLNGAIIRNFYHLPNGDTTLQVQGEDFRVQANVNADRATVAGISGHFTLKMNAFEFHSSYSVQEGKSYDQNEVQSPLAHIPPGYGKTSISYAFADLKMGLNLKYNSFKSIDNFAPGSSDNEDFATPEGALSWSTLNFNCAYAFSDKISGNISLENIFDKHYRVFSSGVSAPGRNLITSLSFRF